MLDHSDDFFYNGDGDEAEVFVYAPDDGTARASLDRTLPAAGLPEVRSPVYAAASEYGYGRAVLSGSHAVPALASVPRRGVLLSTGVLVGDLARNLSIAPEEIGREIVRRLFEVRGSAPRSSPSLIRRMCEGGASAAAEDGMIEEEDLEHFAYVPGAPDTVGRRDLLRGERDWADDSLYRGISVLSVGEVLDAEGTESLELHSGEVAILAPAGAGDLGRLAFASHEERIAGRVRYGLFDPAGDFDAAPLDTDEATDFLTASSTAANFADARASLLLYMLRRALAGVTEGLTLRACWAIGGVSYSGYSGEEALHLTDLARAGEGVPLVCGASPESGLCVGASSGTMYGSVPTFGVREEDGEWPWEEAGLLRRWSRLGPCEG